MARSKAKPKETSSKQTKNRPALSQEAKENQLIGLAMDLVEQRLRDGTATSQEVCLLLKLGTTRERIEKEILERQKDLYEAKTESLQTAKHIEELYSEAIKAMRRYSGNYDEETYDGPI